MHPTPSTKIPFRDIKDHADLMEALISLMQCVVQSESYCWDNADKIQYLKSEISHFLRIQSAAQGISVECPDGPFEKSGAVPDHDVRKHSNNPNL